MSMKKIISQFTVAIVCALLGFMLTYQFKLLNVKESVSSDQGYNNPEITAEVEQLSKLKDELEKKNNDLMAQLKNYEKSATDSDAITQEIKKELDNSRMLMGYAKVQGQGVTITLTPKSNVFSTNVTQPYIDHRELAYLVNELDFAGAEAVSINDQRITIQSGMRSASNNSYILINDEKISPSQQIVIKAIGDKSKLKSELDFNGVMSYDNLKNYDYVIEPEDSLVLPAYNKTYTSQYIKPVND